VPIAIAEPKVPQVAPSGVWNALKGAGLQWLDHKDAKAGAAIAYYSIFSIGPLIVVVISIAGLIFGREGVQAEVTTAIKGLLGDKGAEAVNTMLTSAGKPSEGFFASIIGTVALIFAAIGVVVQLKEALNAVWEVKRPPGKGIWGFVRAYVLSLAGVLAIAFLLLTSMLLTAGLSAFTKAFASAIPEALMQAGSVGVSFIVISVLFALMFKWLPDAQVGGGMSG
jgi:membrane protein